MHRVTQREKIKTLFTDRPRMWIPLSEIISLGIAMYPPRIKELRDIEHMDIRNKIEPVNGMKRSFYMYIPQEKQLTFV